MQLIDKDALMIEFAKYVKRSNNSDFAPTPTWNNAVSIVESAPTIDAVPVVHGYNKLDCKSLYECSVCGWECWDTLCGDTDIYNFCPNCGAKMDGKEQRDDIL